jgi:hypothetical protein
MTQELSIFEKVMPTKAQPNDPLNIKYFQYVKSAFEKSHLMTPKY